MDSGKSDGEGRFSLAGHTSEFTPIDPKLNIYHDCDDGIKVSRNGCTNFTMNKNRSMSQSVLYII